MTSLEIDCRRAGGGGRWVDGISTSDFFFLPTPKKGMFMVICTCSGLCCYSLERVKGEGILGGLWCWHTLCSEFGPLYEINAKRDAMQLHLHLPIQFH